MNEEILDGVINITPEDSAAPVYVIPPTPEEVSERERLMEEWVQRQSEASQMEEVRKSAMEKLAKLGLTEEEAKTVIGL